MFLFINVPLGLFLGGAFLVPYFIFVACGGAPLLFLEVGLGQFMSQGNISVWNICPIFKGKTYVVAPPPSPSPAHCPISSFNSQTNFGSGFFGQICIFLSAFFCWTLKEFSCLNSNRQQQAYHTKQKEILKVFGVKALSY